MEIAQDVVSWVLLLAGSAFAVIGGVGILRFPDFYSRMHAGGITDTLGAGLILAGLMVQAGLSLLTLKLFMVLWFLYVSSPTSAHALAKAAREFGLEPWQRNGGGRPQ